MNISFSYKICLLFFLNACASCNSFWTGGSSVSSSSSQSSRYNYYSGIVGVNNKVAVCIDGVWGDYTELGLRQYKMKLDENPWVIYPWGNHPSQYSFRVSDMKWTEKKATEYVGTGTVSYYVDDNYPTLKSALLRVGFPYVSPDDTGGPKKKITRENCTIKFMIRDNGMYQCYVWVEGVGIVMVPGNTGL